MMSTKQVLEPNSADIRIADFSFGLLGFVVGVLFTLVLGFSQIDLFRPDGGEYEIERLMEDGTVVVETYSVDCGNYMLVPVFGSLLLAPIIGSFLAIVFVWIRNRYFGIGRSVESRFRLIPLSLLPKKPTLAELDEGRDRWGAS